MLAIKALYYEFQIKSSSKSDAGSAGASNTEIKLSFIDYKR